MATAHVPTDAYNLHLRPDGRWVACCPSCGFELAEGWHEGKAAAKAARIPCPICHGLDAAWPRDPRPGDGRYRRRGTAPAGEELTGMVNLDDTRHCPIAPECESCGRLEELAVLTWDAPVGVLCMTLCDVCEVAGVLPIFSPAEETARVLEHRQHVGVDVDQMTGEGDLA